MTAPASDPAPIRLGMVGGGQGAFIGAIHRMAAALDGRYVLVAGALSSTPERSAASGRALGLASDRCYATWADMLRKESARPAHDRIQAVSIVTPNSTHFAIAMAFVEAGFNVICDKPMVVSSEEARALADAVKRSGVVFAVTYNYTGYPMVRQAAAMIRAGELGEIRKVFVEYHQGWLASAIETRGEGGGQKQASWRQNPALAGGGGAIGDIGTHAENLVGAVTGLQIESLCAELTRFVPGRALDDDASVLLRFKGGARGVMTVSQVCIGEANNLTLRVHGSTGSLAWRQEEPETLTCSYIDGSVRVLRRGGAGLAPAASHATRTPSGHPEGFIEAFANIYRDTADAIAARAQGRPPATGTAGPPGVECGARGVQFIERVLESAKGGGAWVKF